MKTSFKIQEFNKIIFLILLFFSGNNLRAYDLNFIKGSYYIRVSSYQASLIPLCNPSNVSLELSGSDPFKRICRFSGTYQITRPFVGLGDTLSRYFRIYYSDTSLVNSFKDSLLTLAYIEKIESLPEMKTFGYFSFPNDKYSSKQWYLEKVKGYQAHDYSTGSGIIIAVIDDAFDLNHEDLKGSFYSNLVEQNGLTGVDDDLNGYVDDIKGWDASDNDNDPNNYGTTDSTMKYHGTMVTGVISALPNNYKGISSLAPDVKIIPIKISSDSSLWNPLTHPLEGLAYAIKSPANIINMSWGGLELQITANSSIMHMLIKQAYNSGKILLASAGNGDYPNLELTPCNEIGRGKAILGYYSINDSTSIPDSIRNYPAAFSEVFSVGATASNNQKTCFSDYGTMSNVDIMAPGETIYTTFPFNGYISVDGTSFASPLVASICALVWSINPLFTKEAVIDRIKNTADNISDINQNIASKIGAGQVNALDAVLNNSVKAWFAADNQSGCSGDQFFFKAQPYPGYTYEWDFGDGNGPQIGSTNESPFLSLPLPSDEALFDITLNIKNSSGIIISSFTRSKYILISKCSSNRINNKQNQWIFATYCRIEFKEGIAKQSLPASNLPTLGNMVNFTTLHRTNSTSIKYAAVTKSTYPTLYNCAKDQEIDIGLYGSNNPIKMYVNDVDFSQGEFFVINSQKSIYISNYDTNSLKTNIGLRYAIIRDSTSNRAYIKDHEKGYSINGPSIADKTNDGSVKIESGMTFIPRCDNLIWMIVKGKSGAYKDSLMVYLINTNPASFSITFQKAYYCPPLYTTDYIRANRYGTMIVCSSKEDSSFIIYDFKKNNGKLTFKHQVSSQKYYNIAPVFSEKGNILYITCDNGVSQVNLNYKNPKENIVEIYKDYYLKDKVGNKRLMYGLQLGPDGRIYTNLPSYMYTNNRLGIVSQPNRFFYNSFGGSRENYLPLGLRLSHSGASTYHGITEYLHASESNNLPTEMFATYISCNIIKLSSNSCNPLREWNYIYNGYPKSRYADEFLVYLDSFPSAGVTLTMVDGSVSISKLCLREVLPPSALTASASASCNRNIPINYKFKHSVLNSTDIFVREWNINGGEIYRYLGDSSIDVLWNGDGIQGTLKAVVIHPLSGCRDSCVFSVTKKPPIKIRNSGLPPFRYDSAYITYNSNFYLSVADTGYRPTYTSFLWFKDGVKITSYDTIKRIKVIEPGTYWIVANGPCGSDTSNKLVVVTECNAIADYTNWTPSGTYSGQIITLAGKVDIGGPSKAVFQNCILFMKDCSYFEVSTLDTLIFINTKIIGCSAWKGIRVLGNNMPRLGGNCGYLSMTNSSLENSIIGVSAEDGGEIHINNNRFINNFIHIAFNSYSLSNNATVKNNSFGRLKPNSSSCLHPMNLNLIETQPMIYLESVKDITLETNDFEGNNIYKVNSVSNVEIQQTDNVDLKFSEFISEAHYGIYIKNSSNSNLLGNLFNDQNRYSPLLHNGMGNTITGLYAKNCLGLYVDPGNSFWCCKHGIEWYSDQVYTFSNITESSFTGCSNGVLFAQNINPIKNKNSLINNDTTYRIQLKINCNLFDMDSIAIVGSGKLLDQGGVGSGRRNKFVNNINWDIALQNHFSYTYHTASGVYRPNLASPLLLDMILINNLPNIGYYPNFSQGSSPCANGFFIKPSESLYFSLNVNLYPNPVNDGNLNIKFSDLPIDEIKFELFNSVGQNLQSGFLFDQENIIQLKNYPIGVYFIKLTNNYFRGTYRLILE